MSSQSNRAACAHEDMHYVGDNRDARFLRCASCGVVFVLQGGMAWAIPAVNADGDEAAARIDRDAS